MKQKSKGFHSAISITPDLSIQAATSILKDANIDAIPVIDHENRLVGVLTVQHILVAISNGDRPSDPVENIMEAVVHGDDSEEADEILKNFKLPIDSKDMAFPEVSKKELTENIAELYRNLLLEMEAIINSTHNLIISVDIAGRIKIFNKSAEKFFGKKFEDVYNEKIEDIYPESRLSRVARTGTSEILQKVRIKDHFFLSNRSPIFDKNNCVIGAVAILQDVSELESSTSGKAGGLIW